LECGTLYQIPNDVIILYNAQNSYQLTTKGGITVHTGCLAQNKTNTG